MPRCKKEDSPFDYPLSYQDPLLYQFVVILHSKTYTVSKFLIKIDEIFDNHRPYISSFKINKHLNMYMNSVNFTALG